MCVCFECKTGSSGLDYQLSLLRACLGVPGPGKVVKIRPKRYLAVLMGNDKNWTQKKSVGMFQELNRVILGLFSTFPALVVPGPEKS